MTRTVKLENHRRVLLVDNESGVGLFVDDWTEPVFLTPRDVGRLIAALARTKAALADRQRRRTVAA